MVTFFYRAYYKYHATGLCAKSVCTVAEVQHPQSKSLARVTHTHIRGTWSMCLVRSAGQFCVARMSQQLCDPKSRASVSGYVADSVSHPFVVPATTEKRTALHSEGCTPTEIRLWQGIYRLNEDQMQLSLFTAHWADRATRACRLRGAVVIRSASLFHACADVLYAFTASCGAFCIQDRRNSSGRKSM